MIMINFFFLKKKKKKKKKLFTNYLLKNKLFNKNCSLMTFMELLNFHILT